MSKLVNMADRSAFPFFVFAQNITKYCSNAVYLTMRDDKCACPCFSFWGHVLAVSEGSDWWLYLVIWYIKHPLFRRQATSADSRPHETSA
jgi:hypothetical protein